MIYTLDAEFIDTPTCSALISLALVAENGRELYFETPYPEAELTPWLEQHVVPHLTGDEVSLAVGADMIREFVGGSKYDRPAFWAYYGAYDWYWFCRVFGGMMNTPEHYPHLCNEYARFQQGIPNLFGPEHNALNDAKSLMAAMRAGEMVRRDAVGRWWGNA